MDVGTIIGKTFGRRFYGADPDEVDFFLREVGEYVRNLQRQISQLQQQLAGAEMRKKDFDSITEVIPTVLDDEQIKTPPAGNPEEESARSIVGDAEKQAARILENSRAELSKIRESVMILRSKKESVSTRLKILLESELDLLKSLEAGENAEDTSPEPEGGKDVRWSEIDEIIKSLDAEA